MPVTPTQKHQHGNYAVQHSSLVLAYSPDNQAHVVYLQGSHTSDYAHDMRFDRNDPEGGSSCDYGGPGTDYSWSVDGNTLTLTPARGTDPCAPRGFLWTGAWTRVP